MLRRGKTKSGSTQTGTIIEQCAQSWLQQQGLIPVEQNYRCKMGEIDLIMRHGELLVFIEVRYRKTASFGGGIESVDWRKQQKLHKAATHYLQNRRQFQHLPCRFDVLAVSGEHSDDKTHDDNLTWQWIEAAFTG